MKKSTAKAGLVVKSGVKGGQIATNHNRPVSGLKVRTGVKAGIIASNHNRTVLPT